ncbi:MAG: 30S ribosomal protein S3 [Pseudomonadota bacterium]|nr:30S ribosomal protein S3 [Pseudomonadota bacterium]
MGQKQNPVALRLGINKTSSSCWYAGKAQYKENIMEDFKLRQYIEKNYSAAGIASVLIQRTSQNIQVRISCAKPGIIIGKKGSDIDKMRAELSNLMGKAIHLSIDEYRKPDLSAKLVAESIANQLKRRVQFRKAMKRAMQSTIRAGAKGIKILVSGRLNGAEIARSEGCHEGRVPLHTFKADIDYYIATAKTTYGIIGVKVWIFREDPVLTKQKDEVV